MGACEVWRTAYGTTANEAYRDVCHEDAEEYGIDPYNGSFTTCTLGRVYKLADKYVKGNEKKAEKMLVNSSVSKWSAHGVDMGVHHYEIIKPKMQKNTGKATVKYCVHSLDGCGDITGYSKAFDTMEKAKKYAMEETLRERKTHVIQKKYVTENGKADLATVTLDVRVTKSRPKSVPKGAMLREIHAYCFYGWAAC
jgi:hypothetical protein